ncbi:hypothetical protein OIB37_03075 [Streptomyces sp. NBC_00820]|uniref:hypothetical protein n=1 Tax=Streptomyces sp. NBC_00820 TaxID=2975842 RepID=UPI002ED18BB6|nr:hypothetical protein OIB37_03075 [Streptomyces sp. NBC_00820]
MRRTAGAVCTVVGLGLVSGCSPADLPLAAVWLNGAGKPVAEVRLCDGDRASNVSLRSWGEREFDDVDLGLGDDTDDAGGSTATPSRTAGGDVEDSDWTAYARVRDGTTFPLFSPPPSWRAEATGPQVLTPGRVYALSFTGSRQGWTPYDGHVYFTADDLASLRPGQVWADDHAMDRDAFDKLVDEHC